MDDRPIRDTILAAQCPAGYSSFVSHSCLAFVNDPSPRRLKAWIPALKWCARLAILALVVWGMAETWDDAREKFATHAFSLADLDWRWIAASCGLYVLATLPSAWFFHEALLAMGQRPRWTESFRAYYVGHLGKYVPGKALVVVIRAALVRSERTDGAVAALAVFVETLTLMAVGAAIAAVVLAIQGRSHEQAYLTVIALGLGIGAGVPTAPPLFRAVVRRLPYVKSHPAVAPAVERLNFALMARGWGAMTLAWAVMGLSLWATLKAMPGMLEFPVSNGQIPMLTACIALATVAGFMSLIPGGLGVRELVVTAILEPMIGPAGAIISAVVMRLVSLVSEVLVSTILYFVVRSPPDAPPTSQP
jgi:uncharacterized membrane protein YbhN (UPF0104 family)